MNSLTKFTNQIIQGDCRDVLTQLPANSVGLVLTDPPYLVNYRSRDGRRIAGDIASDWLKPAFAEVSRVLQPGRYCISFYGWNKADVFLRAWRAAGLTPVAHLVWVKDYPSSVRLVKRLHEQAYVLAKGQPDEPVESITDVLKWKYTGNNLHPTQKPVTSLLPLVMTFSNPGDIVLDPFAGSGSTALAARIAGRKYIGIELDAHYGNLARKRLATT